MPSVKSSVQNKSGKKVARASEKSSAKSHPAEAAAAPIKAPRGAKTPSLLRGMKDILPKEEWYWLQLFGTAQALARAYGYAYMATPIVEEAALFIRSLGRGTDVVDKEMYVFEDRDGTRVALRPEWTASVARAYIGHGMHTWPQPVKVWYLGPMFRHDRPQAGRYRQFHQFDCEVLGERHPAVDAELIVLAYNFLRDLGIQSQVHINSIGNREDRERYLVELVGYLRSKRSYLCEDCKKRLVKNPLRILDCKMEQCVPVIEEAPQIVDWLSDASKDFFMKVLEYLDELEVPYMLRATLVRGLDYYTDTVFELYEDGGEAARDGAQSALGGGGRYDGLVEQLGGRPTPASGFALGLERIISVLRRRYEAEGKDPVTGQPKIFFAQLGDQARRRTLALIERLRRDGIEVLHNVAKSSLKAQLELAHKAGVTHTLILGQKEVQDGTVIIRDMESGNQEVADQKKISIELQKIMKAPR